MRIMGVNVLVVLLIFSLTLSGLVYARKYERALNVDAPLAETLESDQWVQRYVLNSKDGELVIYPGWSDRMPAHLGVVLESVSEIAGDRYSVVRVVDTRTAELEELFYLAHLVVNQGLSTGDYLSMQRELDALAEEEGLDSAKAWVSSGSAVVLIRSGDSFMYEEIGNGIADDMPVAVRFEGS